MKISLSIFLCCLSVCLLGAPWSSAVGQDGLVVEEVSFQQANDRTEKVSIKLSGPMTPKIYTMDGDNKPRLVIDLVGARYAGIASPAVEGGDTVVQSIRIGEHPAPNAKVRVVLDLQPGRSYTYTKDFLKQENTLNVNLVPADTAKTVESAVIQIEAATVKKKVKGDSKIIVVEAEGTEPQSGAEKPVTMITATRKKVEKEIEAEVEKPAEATAAPVEEKTAEAPPAPDEAAGGLASAVPQPKPTEATEYEETKVSKPETRAEVKPEVKPEEAASADAQVTEKPASGPEVNPKAETAGGPQEEAAVETAEAPPELTAKIESQEPVQKPVVRKESVAAAKDTSEKETAAEQATANEQAAEETEAPAPVAPLLLDVTYENNSSKGEMIFFHLNGFYPPNVSAVEGNTPQVVCEFANMAKDDKVKPLIEARGAYVQKIETRTGKDDKQVRVILTLAPNRDYDLRQVFFKEDNLFVLVVDTMGEENGDKAAESRE
jgi:hypothetical protein